jgi:hypothetical protein
VTQSRRLLLPDPPSSLPNPPPPASLRRWELSYLRPLPAVVLFPLPRPALILISPVPVEPDDRSNRTARRRRLPRYPSKILLYVPAPPFPAFILPYPPLLGSEPPPPLLCCLGWRSCRTFLRPNSQGSSADPAPAIRCCPVSPPTTRRCSENTIEDGDPSVAAFLA